VTHSHPKTLLKIVESALRGPCQIEPGDTLGVGVSGGPDSMALLHALALLRERVAFSLIAISVDHGLRPAAAQEVELVRSFAAQLAVPFEAVHVAVEPGENLQARARDARYRALWSATLVHHPDAYLATAHHADDRAETVLLRLIRGTSPDGLGVLREREGKLLRPLIRARKSDVRLHNERHGVPFVEDPSNQSERFLRVRVRKELLPLLSTMNPSIVEGLCNLADEADGGALGLNREQRRQLREALSKPHEPIDLPLGRGLRIIRER
jgi:tRNA(Ile)-lysidine synthase